MSSVGDREQRLILDLLLGRIPKEQFYREFPTSPEEASLVGLAMLERALRERDPVGVEYGLYLGHRFGFSQHWLHPLSVLALEDWHLRHEDVVDGIAKLRAHASVDVLYRTALVRYPYLDYDEARALGVKCIWALGEIQTPDALNRLRDLMASGEDVIESQAEEQLARVEREGISQAARDAAHDILAATRTKQ